MQSFFLRRADRFGDRLVLAYDSTTISSYSGRIWDLRRGFSKTRDGLDTVKLLALYDQDACQQVAFARQPGNLPDVASVANALEQLLFLGLDRCRIVTDNGFYSWDNISLLLVRNFKFLSLVEIRLRMVRDIIV